MARPPEQVPLPHPLPGTPILAHCTHAGTQACRHAPTSLCGEMAFTMRMSAWSSSTRSELRLEGTRLRSVRRSFHLTWERGWGGGGPQLGAAAQRGAWEEGLLQVQACQGEATPQAARILGRGSAPGARCSRWPAGGLEPLRAWPSSFLPLQLCSGRVGHPSTEGLERRSHPCPVRALRTCSVPRNEITASLVSVFRYIHTCRVFWGVACFGVWRVLGCGVFRYIHTCRVFWGTSTPAGCFGVWRAGTCGSL